MKSPPQDHLITPYFSYADDTEYSIQPIRWLLRPISVWPVSSIKERILSAVLLIVCVFLIAGTLVPCALAIFLDQNKDVETKVRDFGPLSNWVLASLKYCSLLSHVGDIRRCLEHVDADWRAVTKHEDREMMLRNAKIGRFIALFAALFMHSGVFSYSIFQAMTMNESVLGDNASMHSLPFAFYDKILDTTTSPTYEIVFIMQFLSTFVVNSVAVSTVSLIAVFVMHACGQIKILISLLENFVDETSEKWENSTQGKYAVIVEHHLRVLSFVSYIDKITNIICLVEVMGCTLHMCLLGYYCIMDWTQGDKESIVSYVIILISVTFNIFIFCYIGEILSEQVYKTAYNSAAKSVTPPI